MFASKQQQTASRHVKLHAVSCFNLERYQMTAFESIPKEKLLMGNEAIILLG